MARRGQMQHVDLVEDDGTTRPGSAPAPDLSTSAAAPPHATPAADRRRRRRTVLTSALAALAVLAAVLVVHVRADARERHRLASLADLPFVAAPLDGPPRVAWTAPEGRLDMLVAPVGDVLVSIRTGFDQRADVVAVDATDGSERWRVEALASVARDAPDDAEILGFAGTCVAHPVTPDAVACLATDAAGYTDGEKWQSLPPTVARLLVLDARDGRVLTDLTDALPRPLPRNLAAAGADLAVWDDADDVLRVRALTPEGGVAWERTLEAPATEGAPAWVGSLDARTAALVTPQSVHVVGPDGADLRVAPLAPTESAQQTTTGRVVIVPSWEAHVGALQGAMPTPSGVRLVTADSEVDLDGTLVPATDDGSVPGLLLTLVDTGTLQAWNGDGERSWTWDLDGVASWFRDSRTSTTVLDGRVHMAGPGLLVTLDARTGRELWRSDALGSGDVVTDGRLLLGLADPTTSDAIGPELVALRRDDGTVAWRAPLPVGTDLVMVQARLLLAVESPDDGPTTYHVLAGDG
ncbi:PQQ-binding-like beta-propeller repeat protein [Cellulomonas iranensis]|uniref:outer membrane protein assembly factor BamB family protein n=1 Tax=Cellulomonas iranensis TaxID=76862 RepID=UPI003D7D4E0E